MVMIEGDFVAIRISFASLYSVCRKSVVHWDAYCPCCVNVRKIFTEDFIEVLPLRHPFRVYINLGLLSFVECEVKFMYVF